MQRKCIVTPALIGRITAPSVLTGVIFSVAAMFSATALAGYIVQIGDNDGYGYGAGVLPDGGTLPFEPNIPTDKRSVAEAAAANGAQQTDFYSALYAPLPETFNAIFPLAGNTMTSATLTIDMFGFRALTFGQILASYNGVIQPNLLNFEDGPTATRVRTFVLSPAAISNANTAGSFIVNFDRSTSGDGIMFDYFRLDATVVPEPSTFALAACGFLLAGLAARRRVKQRRISADILSFQQTE